MAVAPRRSGNPSSHGPDNTHDPVPDPEESDNANSPKPKTGGDEHAPKDANSGAEFGHATTTTHRPVKKSSRDLARRRAVSIFHSPASWTQNTVSARNGVQSWSLRTGAFQVTAIRSCARSPGGEHPVSFGYIIQPRHPIQWAPAWPELIDYYTHNAPDYTGLGLYSVSRYPASHKSLLRESSVNFTVQILMAERAKLDPPLKKLAVLKGFVLKSLNDSLQQELSESEMYQVLNAVNAIALYDLVYEGGGASALHLAGLSLLLQRFGGLEKMMKVDCSTGGLVRYCDAMNSYLQKEPRRFLVTTDAPSTDVIYGIHHLRLAMQPDRSGLSDLRWRSHLMMSVGSPVQGLFIILGKLHSMATALLDSPNGSTSLTPSAAIVLVHEWDEWVRASTQRPNELHSPIFCEEDKRNHMDMFEMIRLATAVLLQQFRAILLGIDAVDARVQLDYFVQALLLHILSPKLAVRSREAIFWACLVGGPFLHPAHPLMGAVLGIVLPLSRKLGLVTWRDVQELLASNFYCSAVQERSCKAFWEYAQQQRLMDVSQGAVAAR